MFNYENYKQQTDALTLEDAITIYNLISKALKTQDDYLPELWRDILHSALAYVEMRSAWNYFSNEEKLAKDNRRTDLHNTFIINLKAFHKLCEQLNSESSWLVLLGPSEDRKRWGDFAGYLLLIETLKAR